MSPRTVAIHQPNFFPWLGYFAKIARADVFVFLDTADYPKSGNSMGSYVNRVRIASDQDGLWWGCPVVRESGPQPIDTVRIRPEPWAAKKLKTLEQTYAKAPYFEENAEAVQAMVLRDEPLLARYNMANIRDLCRMLGLEAELVVESDLGTRSASTDRLVEIVRAVGGERYLSGGGGDKYQEQEAFEAAGLELAYAGFTPRPYAQVRAREFLPGLSVLDCLFNCGAEGTRQAIEAGLQ